MFFAYAYDEQRNLIKKLDVKIENRGSCFIAKIEKSRIPENTFDLDFMPKYGNGSAEEKGYMVAPRGGPYVKSSYMMCCFKKQDDYHHIIEGSAIPIFGVKKENFCFVAIVTGMRCDYDVAIGVKGGIHYIYPIFKFDGETPYEDICVEYHSLTGNDASYSGMARLYRKYQLDRGACVPLKQRTKDNKYLDYAANAINVRIRLGMKPIPTPVMEQTAENEPEMVISCTFDRMKDLIDEFERQGIKKAEFCLIGWNLKGHDGRYPEIFPVEESLGGEQKLRELIKYGQDKGFQMTCHSNSSDAYTVSSAWNKEDILVLKNGELSVDPYAWSGGRMYQLCPSVGEKQAEKLIPKIADLGFKGVHYIDCISLHPPRKCYSKIHPLNRKESAECNNRIMAITKKNLGGFSSEGAYDLCIGNLDFALLVHSFALKTEIPICDRVIPLWELVYHGTVLHNTSWETGTFNSSEGYSVDNEKKRLKNIEFGGRPVAYYHFFFHGHENEVKLGLTTATDELMKKSVTRIKIMIDDYKKLSYLQYEFMENHEQISENIFRTTYSDGTEITVDYDKLTYDIKKPENNANYK